MFVAGLTQPLWWAQPAALRHDQQHEVGEMEGQLLCSFSQGRGCRMVMDGAKKWSGGR